MPLCQHIVGFNILLQLPCSHRADRDRVPEASGNHIRKSRLYLTLVNNEADKGITTVPPLQTQCTPTTTSLVEAEGQISPLLSLPLMLKLTAIRCIITCLKERTLQVNLMTSYFLMEFVVQGGKSPPTATRSVQWKYQKKTAVTGTHEKFFFYFGKTKFGDFTRYEQ